MQITTTEKSINILGKKEFDKSVTALYKEQSPASARKAIIDFYQHNTADEDTLYERYRYLKFDSEVLGPVLLGALLGLIMTGLFAACQDTAGANSVMLIIVFFLYLVIAFTPLYWYPRAFMKKDVLLIKPTEIAILEKLLDIKPEL